MLKRLFLAWVLGLALDLPVWAQQSDFKTLDLNLNKRWYTLRYKIFTQKPQGRKIIRKDFVTFHLQTRTESDSILKTSYPNSPLTKEISPEEVMSAEKGFLEDMLMQLHIGDSALFLVKSDMQFEALNRKRPAFIKSGTDLKYYIKILKVYNEQEVKKIKDDEEFRARKIDEKAIIQYTAKSGLPYKKTYSGIWYHIEQQGEGDFALKDDVVSIQYTGKHLDGKIFGSSAQDGRNFEFPVGGKVAIRAFDEIMLLLKKGAKAKFVIPSYLAYGATGLGDKIPPFTPIIFEMEFVDIVSRKIIIENKGDINQEEKNKEKAKPKTPNEIEKQKQIEKDVKKRGINNKIGN
ncbi:MAG: FKBP-type peptidyl-prolyl cis-trans isomerase [Microscillaceae bacterium]|jgi:FKBP-type peptidyl-prolyl cis-trans isomerase|nr:FKBP-type peptidyl-prolyl cis-trans isomerase [Microscillaceae bacterium]